MARQKESKQTLVIPGKAMRFACSPSEVLKWLDEEGIKYTVKAGKGTEVNLMVQDQSRMGQVLALVRANFEKTNAGWARMFPPQSN